MRSAGLTNVLCLANVPLHGSARPTRYTATRPRDQLFTIVLPGPFEQDFVCRTLTSLLRGSWMRGDRRANPSIARRKQRWPPRDRWRDPLAGATATTSPAGGALWPVSSARSL